MLPTSPTEHTDFSHQHSTVCLDHPEVILLQHYFSFVFLSWSFISLSLTHWKLSVTLSWQQAFQLSLGSRTLIEHFTAGPTWNEGGRSLLVQIYVFMKWLRSTSGIKLLLWVVVVVQHSQKMLCLFVFVEPATESSHTKKKKKKQIKVVKTGSGPEMSLFWGSLNKNIETSEDMNRHLDPEEIHFSCSTFSNIEQVQYVFSCLVGIIFLSCVTVLDLNSYSTVCLLITTVFHCIYCIYNTMTASYLSLILYFNYIEIIFFLYLYSPNI